MIHEQDARPREIEDAVQTARNTRHGLILFVIYAAIYALFMALNAFWPESMETPVFQGVNLAVAFGIGLIVAAFVLALLYAWICRTRKAAENQA